MLRDCLDWSTRWCIISSLSVDMVREFVYDVDGLAFLKENWLDVMGIGTGRSEFRIAQVTDAQSCILRNLSISPM